MEAAGFVYSGILTNEMKAEAQKDNQRKDLVDDMIKQNKPSYHVAQHLWTTLQVCAANLCYAFFLLLAFDIFCFNLSF